jgi:hypothetical protein
MSGCAGPHWPESQLNSETTDQQTERVMLKREKIDEELIALDFSGDLKSVNRPVYFRLPEGKAAAFACIAGYQPL